jgi:AhpD family alkylhydroperoxidase
MGEMKDLLNQANDSLARWGKEFPKQMEGFGKFMEAVETPGALDVKQKELMAVALSITAHCHWCIAFHVSGALKAGANRDEVMEAAWVAVLMGGGPAVMYMQLVEEALNDFEGAAKPASKKKGK